MSTKAHAADVAMPAQVLNDSVVEGRRRGWPLSEALSVSTNPCKPTALLSTQLSPALLCSSLLDCAEVPFIPQQSVAKQSWNLLREPTLFPILQSGGACPHIPEIPESLAMFTSDYYVFLAGLSIEFKIPSWRGSEPQTPREYVDP